MALFGSNFVLVSLTFLGILTSALKDVEVVVPLYVRQSEDVLLRCNYNLEMDNLYAVKWYKDGNEFYRFVPKEVPPQQVFTINREEVDVDIRFSNEYEVLLRNVSLDQSGLFKCSVSAESTFQTVEKSKHVTIVAIGYESPKVQMDRPFYNPGETVRANCTLPQAYPLPNITWFINERKVKSTVDVHWITSKVDATSGDETMSTNGGSVIGAINFTLPETFVPTSLMCRIQMFDLYDEVTLKRIQPIPRRQTLKAGASSGGTATQLNFSAIEINFNSERVAVSKGSDIFRSSSEFFNSQNYLAFLATMSTNAFIFL